MTASTHTPLAADVTPCIGVCRMDASGLCAGCSRSLVEIASWASLSHCARLCIMEKLAARKPARTGDSQP
jgi:predicted Fe-S protein YdhL (DUF1289 family)